MPLRKSYASNMLLSRRFYNSLSWIFLNIECLFHEFASLECFWTLCYFENPLPEICYGAMNPLFSSHWWMLLSRELHYWVKICFWNDAFFLFISNIVKLNQTISPYSLDILNFSICQFGFLFFFFGLSKRNILYGSSDIRHTPQSKVTIYK